MPGRLLIYGATGFSGRLVAERAQGSGLDVVLAGRSAQRLQPQAESLGLPWRVARLDDHRALDTALEDVDVVLHVAGPFTATAQHMLEACLRTNTHYLDLSGELPVYPELHRYDAAARSRGLVVMPGVGYVVAASDFLAAHVAARMPDARRLRIGLSRTDLISRGTLRAMLGLVREGVTVRRDGELTSVPVGRLERTFDYGDGDRLSTALSWADVYTAYYTTGIPDIEVYVEADLLARCLYQVGAWFAVPSRLPPWRQLLEWQASFWPLGPSAAARAAARRVIVAEAEDVWRRCVRARLHTPDGYSFTPAVALAIVQRVLDGDFLPGFQTPAGVYGADFVLSLDGVRREDLDAVAENLTAGETPTLTGAAGPGLATWVPFVELDHEPQIPPPYVFSNISIQSFRLPANLGQLRALCDKRLNVGTLEQRGFEYRPMLPFVDLEVISDPRMESMTPAFSDRGHSSRHAMYFRLLVGKFELHSFLWIPTEVAFFLPYIAVDNAWSDVNSREVSGSPKLVASFELGGDASSPYPIAVMTDDYSTYESDTPLEHKLFVTIEEASAPGPLASLAGYKGWPWGVPDLEGLDPAVEPLLQRAFGTVGGFQTIQSRQSRDAERQERACCQAPTRSEFRVTRTEPPNLLPAADITISASPSIPVAQELGLPPGRPVRPLLQYSVECDLEFGEPSDLFVRRA